MEKGQRTQVKIQDMTTEGQGLGRNSEGFTIFVKGAVVGDVVDVELTKVKKNYAFGQIVADGFVEKSPNRIEPNCQYAGQCGGCSFASVDYETQLVIKEKMVSDKLIRLAGIENPKVNKIVPMADPFRYRNKASLPISTGGIITRKGGILENLGEVAIGFYKEKSHDVVNCEDCLIQSEPAMAVVNAVREFMTEDNITAFDPKWEKGLMRHVVVKTAKGTGEIMVILVVNGKGIPNAEKLVSMIDDAIFDVPVMEDGIEYNLASVILNVNKKKGSEILGSEWITLAGKPTILDKVGDLNFEISPLAFYQVNPTQMTVLYDKAIEYANLTGKETVLDLYCGVGAIGLFAANKAKEVIGIESVKGAVLDANRNAVINGIVNARYVCGKAEEALPRLMGFTDNDSEESKAVDCDADKTCCGPNGCCVVEPKADGLDDKADGLEPHEDKLEKETKSLRIEKADVVILDPPRSGCDERLLGTVVKVAPERIVYVSCDPATLARDVKFLGSNGYEFVECTPVDMFPWNGHVETVLLMVKA
ncbi:MAG: 23S rRNA (uracil(1939)-C(5))-methyltransferase RlmD [Anaerovoracaceae bacterium]